MNWFESLLGSDWKLPGAIFSSPLVGPPSVASGCPLLMTISEKLLSVQIYMQNIRDKILKIIYIYTPFLAFFRLLVSESFLRRATSHFFLVEPIPSRPLLSR